MMLTGGTGAQDRASTPEESELNILTRFKCLGGGGKWLPHREIGEEKEGKRKASSFLLI